MLSKSTIFNLFLAYDSISKASLIVDREPFRLQLMYALQHAVGNASLSESLTQEEKMNLRNALSIAVAAVVTIVAIGCRTVDDDTADLKHEIGVFAASGADSFRWRAVTEAEYENYALELFNKVLRDSTRNASFSTAPLPSNDRRVQRVRELGAQIDKVIRTANPKQLLGIPVPQFELLDTDIPNGMVAPASVCYDAIVQFEDTVSANPQELISNGWGCGFLSQDGGIGIPDTKDGGECRCTEQAATPAEISRIVDWMNTNWFDRRETSCKLTLDKNSSSAPLKIRATGCDEDRRKTKNGTLNHLRKLVFMATANRVSITLGVMKAAKNEDQLVATIAHELAHYYRSHANPPMTDYDYFYRLSDAPAAGRPTRDQSLEKTGELMKRVTTPFKIDRQIGAQFDARLVAVFGRVAKRLSDDGLAILHQSCTDLVKQWNSDAGSFARGTTLKEPEASALKAFETTLLNCLETIRIDDAVPGFGRVRRLVKEDFMRDMFMESPYLLECGKPLPSTGTLRQVFEAMETASTSAECDKDRILREVIDKRIAWYTMEQEADEFSLEYLCAHGRPPKSALINTLNLIDVHGDFQHQPFTGINDCRSLYNNGWKKDGKPVYIPVGNFQDTHHSLCYRAYLMDWEIRAHKYQCKGGLEDKGPDPKWASFVSSSGK